jgi:hypothetical protein
VERLLRNPPPSPPCVGRLAISLVKLRLKSRRIYALVPCGARSEQVAHPLRRGLPRQFPRRESGVLEKVKAFERKKDGAPQRLEPLQRAGHVAETVGRPPSGEPELYPFRLTLSNTPPRWLRCSLLLQPPLAMQQRECLQTAVAPRPPSFLLIGICLTADYDANK